MEHLQLDLFQTPQKLDLYANMFCHFTKYCWCEKITTKHSTVIIQFIDKIFAQFGYPVVLQTDNGSEFRNTDMKEYCHKNNIIWCSSRAYKPTTQGGIERLNRTLKTAIYQDWVLTNEMNETQFRDIVMGYNCMVHSVTGFTPHELMFSQCEVFAPEGTRSTDECLMEMIEEKGLIASYQEANPEVPHEWVEEHTMLIMTDEEDILNYYTAAGSQKVVVKPPLCLREMVAEAYIGTNKYT